MAEIIPNNFKNENLQFSVKSDEKRIIDLEEVSFHDIREDCWIIIFNQVYDVTEFLDEHPGGDFILFEYAGRDASMAFKSVGHSKTAIQALEKYFIGELPLNEQIFTLSWFNKEKSAFSA